MAKKWIPYEYDYSSVPQLMKCFNLSELTARALINRGINNIKMANDFLVADIEALHDPFDLKDMEKAVIRIQNAIISHEKICIFGDYDVDGVTATAIMVKALRLLGADVCYYIPNRFDEGYGLNTGALEKLISMQVELLITVDCGIRSIDTVEWATKNNLSVIITDHHECGDTLPNAVAIINPHQVDCTYPFKDLAGVGIAFKLIKALTGGHINESLFKEIIEITAIGTIADVVPLLDENRIIVKNAFRSISHTTNLGLKALIDESGFRDSILSAHNIAFGIAPRINAAGRMADASLCVELFLTDDQEKAKKIAKILDSSNKERQRIESEILESAIEKIETSLSFVHNKILVLYEEGWHIGVLGIVASRLVERYQVPVVLLSIDGCMAKGSARSLEGFNLYEAMRLCSDLFDRFGGHEMAAGVSLKVENIELFQDKINQIAEAMQSNEAILSAIKVDFKLTPEDIHLKMADELLKLEPFGQGNPIPIFVYRGLKVLSARTVGTDNKHLSLTLFDGRNEIKGIGFRLGGEFNPLPIGKKVDIICSMEKNLWNQVESVQLNIKDIKISKN